MRENGKEIYRHIFDRAIGERATEDRAIADGSCAAGAASIAQAELRHAIALAVRELRAAMEKDDNPAVTLAHVRSLDDVEPAALARAYALAERNCVYWPTPGEIRELAGRSESQEAQVALDWVLDYLEVYGADGRQQGGAVIFADDGTGRRTMVAAGPAREAPAIPPQIHRALIALGNGSARHGLLYARQHPRLGGWEDAGGDGPAKAAERIERQWTRCYRQALREPEE